MKLLMIFPHPDDEVYGASGTILNFTQNGETVGLVTLTHGEKGRTLGLADGPEELARVRHQELKDCVAALGIQVHEHHHFPDGGLKQHDFEELVQVAMEAIQKHQPEILLTFQPNGSNGHPDHVTTSKVVIEAFERLNKPCKLWFYSGDVPYNEELGKIHLYPNVRFNVIQHITAKLRAISMHRTQALSTVDFFRRAAERIAEETFHQYHPELDDQTVIPT